MRSILVNVTLFISSIHASAKCFHRFESYRCYKSTIASACKQNNEVIEMCVGTSYLYYII